MSDTTISTYTVPLIGNQTAPTNEAAVAMLDNSLSYIQGALNELAGRQAETDTKNAIIQHDVPISADVSAGTLVYFNSETSTYEPALAVLLPLPGENGASIEAPSARVEGIILYADNNQATGTLLRGGYYKSDTVADNCLGSDAIAGTYYLSTTTAGKATKDTNGLLRQPVLSYYGDGMFSLTLFYMAHDSHYHTTAILTSAWTAVSEDDEDAPENAKWIYDGSLLASAYVGVLSRVTTAVFWNGELQPTLTDTSSQFDIVNGKLYAKTADAPAANSVVIFNHFPFAYNSSVVRSIQSSNENMLRVTDANGVVMLTPYDFIAGDSAPAQLAVSSIVEGKVSYTPVVSGINAGPGMAVSRNINGITTVSLKTLVGDQIDAYSIQHNGTTLITDGVIQYITFPQGRSSEFVMFLPVTDVPEGVTLQAYAWGTMKDSSATLNVTGYFIPQPTADNPTTVPNTTDLTNTVSLAFSGTTDMLSYSEVALTGFTVTQPGMLVARVRTQGTASANYKLLRVGFKLAVAESNSSSAITPDPEAIGMVTGTLPAAQAISAGQAVYINADGKLAVCVANNQGLAGACVGIAMNGGSTGTEITYVISGILSGGSGFVPGTPVYINTDGSLINLTSDAALETFLAGTAMYIQRVGTAVTTNLVQVAIEPAITKGAV